MKYFEMLIETIEWVFNWVMEDPKMNGSFVLVGLFGLSVVISMLGTFLSLIVPLALVVLFVIVVQKFLR